MNDNLSMKICKKCGLPKDKSEYNKRPETREGLRSECKNCQNIGNKAQYAKKTEERRCWQREWNAKNKDKRNKYSRDWYANHKDEVREQRKRWRQENPGIKKHAEYERTHRKERNKAARDRYAKSPEKARGIHDKWRDKNLEHARELTKGYCAKIRNTPAGTINDRISAGIRHSLKGGKRGQKWESLVGYTISQLTQHLEKNFTEGMTWEKLMLGNIHIDHKNPLAAHHYETPKDIDFKKAWALNNLQPMWAHDNMSKGARLNHPFQPSLALAV